MSSSAPSYKSLIDQLTAFADGHFIIRRFTFGEETDYDLEKEGEYPAMHVLHPSVSVEKGAINYDLVIQFADLPRDIETKTTYQMEQISDLFRLGQDLLNTIVNENGVMLFGEDAEIVGTPRMEAFAQETKNNLVVVSLSFTLQLPNDWSACDIPADWTIGQSGGDVVNPEVVYVISVTGLDTDNTDPQNPIVRIAVDGTTITGDGTPADPLVAVGGGGGGGTVTSVDVSADGDAISTSGGPVTSSGTINIEFNGASTDYIDGEGNLQSFPSIPPVAPVDSVNGQTGVVVLDANDVGADVAGSAATAESNANSYTDGAISALTFVEGVTGNIVDNTDPQNPIVTQVQANWNEADNTDPSFIQNKPTIPTGTVTSVGLSAPSEFTVSNSPVTGSGTLTFAKANQNANIVYAGPTTGAAAAPTFRSLVLADMPSGLAKETWSNGQGATTVAAGATEYGSLMGGSIGDSTTESTRQAVTTSAGTMSKWYFRTSSSQPGTGSLVLRSRINGANGNLIITIAAGSAGGTFSDLTNSDTLAAGDLVNYSATNNSSGASAQQLTTSLLFTFT